MQALLGNIGIGLLFTSLVACSSQPSGHNAADPKANPFAVATTFQMPEPGRSSAETTFRLLFSSNVNGETDLCGCAVNPKGGLDRRLNFLRMIDQAAPGYKQQVLVDAGNSLFPNEIIQPVHRDRLLEKARLILKGHAMMGLLVHNVGYLDLSAGLIFLKTEASKAGVSFISTNLADTSGELLFEPFVEIDIGESKKLTVLGLTRGLTRENKEFNILDPEKSLRAALEKIPAGQPVVVLSDLGLAADRQLFAKISRPLIVVGARDLSSVEIPELLGSSILIQGQIQGQQWGVLDVAFKKNARAWYDNNSGKRFVDVWNMREEEIANLYRDRSESSDFKDEIRRVEATRKDLMAYAPINLEKKHIVNYRLYEMSAEYSKANEMTPLMKKVR